MTDAGKVLLKAPVSGPMVPIEKVPDPVFAQKMVGDGISIDPISNELVAPCDGEVIHLHPALHAVTLGLDNGVELLLHVGVDTVSLKGEGFEALVAEGDNVSSGTPLIRFDLDILALNAKSLLTQMVCSTPELVTSVTPSSGTVTAGSDEVLELVLSEGGASDEQEGGGATLKSDAILIPNPTGIHARPAAVLANMAKRFSCKVDLECGGRMANAKSLTALMKLNVKKSDKVVLMATGSDASAAIEELSAAVESGLGELEGKPVSSPASSVKPAVATLPQKPISGDPDLIIGLPASPGLAVGFVYQLQRPDVPVEEKAGTPAEEQTLLNSAYEVARRDLEALEIKLHAENNSAQSAIFAAHRELLEDPELLASAESAIAKGASAGVAWKESFEYQATELEGLDNELLAQRAADLRDVGRRILLILAGEEADPSEFGDQTILFAEDLSPSDTAQLDRSKVLGFCTVQGGSTSHVAILARAMGIPAVVGAEARALEMKDGAPVVLNGSTGEARLHPPEELVQQVKDLREQMETRRANDLASAAEAAETEDGVRIEVVANIGSSEDAAQIEESGGEGVGLLRSEFLFMDRVSAPTEDEQVEAYSAVIKELPEGAPLIIRTLDVGGDKPLAYLPLPPEENPFLGIRGVRVGLQYPELLRIQMRAILRCSDKGNVKIMFPMIASLAEWYEVKAMLDEEVKNVGCQPIPAGMMIEVPSAAVLAGQFAEEVDFFSIGTNDLSQYTLAMDRGHAQLAGKIDGLDPGVLNLIAVTAAAGGTKEKMVGVCGGLAGEVQAVPILIGLGVTELSVSIPVIPRIKALIRSLKMEECKALAEKALKMGSAKEIRKLTPGPLSARIDLSAGAKQEGAAS